MTIKQLISITFLVVLLAGCSDSQPKEIQNEKPEKELSVEDLPEVKGDFRIFEHDLSLYGSKYLMRITPSVDSANNHYTSDILLLKGTDTTFNKHINLDSLESLIQKHQVFKDSSDYLKIGTDFELRKVVYHFVRAYNLYFIADLKSIDSDKELKVMFQLNYMKKKGELFVNGFSEIGWGESRGEMEYEGNRIINPED